MCSSCAPALLGLHSVQARSQSASMTQTLKTYPTVQEVQLYEAPHERLPYLSCTPSRPLARQHQRDPPPDALSGCRKCSCMRLPTSGCPTFHTGSPAPWACACPARPARATWPVRARGLQQPLGGLTGPGRPVHALCLPLSRACCQLACCAPCLRVRAHCLTSCLGPRSPFVRPQLPPMIVHRSPLIHAICPMDCSCQPTQAAAE